MRHACSGIVYILVRLPALVSRRRAPSALHGPRALTRYQYEDPVPRAYVLYCMLWILRTSSPRACSYVRPCALCPHARPRLLQRCGWMGSTRSAATQDLSRTAHRARGRVCVGDVVCVPHIGLSFLRPAASLSLSLALGCSPTRSWADVPTTSDVLGGPQLAAHTFRWSEAAGCRMWLCNEWGCGGRG